MANYSYFYIVLDGLDESPQNFKLLKRLPQLVAKGVKIVVPSRGLPTIAAHTYYKPAQVYAALRLNYYLQMDTASNNFVFIHIS